jgi:Uma2 family endonuclease
MRTHLTPEQCLELDRHAEHKSEYYPAEPGPVGPPLWVHSIIVSNIARELSNALRDRADAICLAGTPVLAGDTVVVPDVAVVCGAPEFAVPRQGALLNPTVVFEVSTPATAVQDGDRKFHMYASLPSVAEYVWITADRIDVRVFTKRLKGEWLMELRHAMTDSATLRSLELPLRLADIYHKVTISVPSVGAGYMLPKR